MGDRLIMPGRAYRVRRTPPPALRAPLTRLVALVFALRAGPGGYPLPRIVVTLPFFLRLEEPLVVGVVLELPFADRAGHDVQVVEVVAGGCRDRVVALRH